MAAKKKAAGAVVSSSGTVLMEFERVKGNEAIAQVSAGGNVYKRRGDGRFLVDAADERTCELVGLKRCSG